MFYTARHRRTTTTDHVRRLTCLAAVFAAAIGVLYAAPDPANARDAAARQTTQVQQAYAETVTDYGSGTLGDWKSLTHGVIGDILDTQYDGTPQADVLVMGDSITTRGYSALIPLITGAGHTIAVNYWSGRPTAPAVDWVLSLSTKPKLVVMATGSNDVMNPIVMTAQIRRLKAGLPSTTTLLWVDVQVCRPAYAVADQRNSMAVNQQIYEEMGDAGVIGWAELFWSAPWRLTYYLQDGVHPYIGKGTAFWAGALAPKIDAALS